MKLSNTHRKILLVLPTSRWRKAAAPGQASGQAQAGFSALGLLVALACLGLLMVGAVIMHGLVPRVPAGAWLIMGASTAIAVLGGLELGRGRKSAAPQIFAGPVPLALSRADAQRDRQEGVADHHVYVAPLPLLLETARLAGPRIRKAGGVPVAPLDSGPARKVPVRGSVRGDLMIVLAVLGALAWCGCDDPPPALPDLGPVDIGSAFAVTKCEMLSMEIDKADGPGPSARAAGIAQTCWLRLIDYRLRRLVPLDDPGPPPPPPAEAPDTMPRPNAVRKTPLSEPGGGPYVVPNSPGGTGFGGGPDVGRTPPSSSDGGGR